MARRKFDFKEEDRIKVLLWCARHCFWCGKFAGVGIEVAHLERENSDIDNAIPLCFDCHAAIGHYNTKHPRLRPELNSTSVITCISINIGFEMQGYRAEEMGKFLVRVPYKIADLVTLPLG